MNKHQNILQVLAIAFEKMDINAIGKTMANNELFDDNTLSKITFLSHLINLFNEFKKFGNTRLISTNGRCSKECGRNKNQKGFVFTGNNSGHFTSFVIYTDGKLITDIVSCSGMVKESDENNSMRLKTSSDYGPNDYKRLSSRKQYLIKECLRAIEAAPSHKNNDEWKKWVKSYEELSQSIKIIDSLFIPPIEIFSLLFRKKIKELNPS